jgi:hypothetical protein
MESENILSSSQEEARKALQAIVARNDKRWEINDLFGCHIIDSLEDDVNEIRLFGHMHNPLIMHVIWSHGKNERVLFDLIQALLDYGADPRICNSYNESILDYLIWISDIPRVELKFIPQFIQVGINYQRNLDYPFKFIWKVRYANTFFNLILLVGTKKKEVLPKELWKLVKEYILSSS